MLLAVVTGFIMAALSPILYRLLNRYSGWAMALVTAGLCAFFVQYVDDIAAGEILQQTLTWVPSMGIALTFTLDGLSLLFSLLITGIGTFIMIFAMGYLGKDPNLPRFYTLIMVFMAAMLGLVLADDLILIFIFWELTSISSYLLIGYKHTKKKAQEAARRALIVTGLGGLAMLAGFIMLSIVAGTNIVSELPAQADVITQSPLYLPLLILILLGAFTKSAQFPFHFWLPGAMEAPAPVSAYLHSATMVKAGIYLMARLLPTLGGTQEWLIIVTTVGTITMLVAAYVAVQQTDLKRILAYSTVSALGLMTMLLGLAVEDAVIAALTFIVVHSLYKGAMFMGAGTLDHETGTRDIHELGGLIRVMPVLGVALIVAAISKAGLPPALGFHGKELIYYATFRYTPLEGSWVYILTGLALVANVLIGITGWMVAIKPFFGEKKPTLKHVHAAPLTLSIGPVFLGITSLVAGIFPKAYSDLFIVPGSATVLNNTVDFTLYYPTKIDEIVTLSIVTIALAIIGYIGLKWLARGFGFFNIGSTAGPERIYGFLYEGTLSFAEAVTKRLQTGNMRHYIFNIVLASILLLVTTIILRFDTSLVILPDTLDIRFYELVLGIVIVVGMVMTVTSSNVLVAIIGLGVIGYGVAIIFMLFSAPDLAMTQFAVETLSVILFVLVLYRLPDFKTLTPDTSRSLDILLSASVGVLMAGLVFVISMTPVESQLSPYFLANSYPAALGRNIVNVILVDFRSIDTMGEIVVIAVAAIGVYTLLQLTPKEEKEHGSD